MTGYPLHAGQTRVYSSDKRHRFVVCGRGWGKTHEAVAESLKAATSARAKILRETMEIVYVGPSYRQTKAIVWKRFKRLIPKAFIASKNETDLTITLKWGPTIRLMGSDNLNIQRGMDIHLLILDEFAFQKEGVWETAEGCLRGQQDRCLIITTPNGPNHAWELWQQVANDDEWERFQEPTWNNPFHDAKGLERKRRRLAKVIYLQEYGAEFAANKGGVYTDFGKANVQPVEIEKGAGEIFIGQDFNAGYIGTIIGQVVGREVRVVDEIITTTHIWDHVEALKGWLSRLGIDHRMVPVITDASGEFNSSSRGTSDSVILRRAGFRTRHDRQNPAIIDRIHSVQSLILNGAGERLLLVNERCRELIRCLMNQRYDSNGKPDKRGNIDHLPDALGYAIWEYFPIRPKAHAEAI